MQIGSKDLQERQRINEGKKQVFLLYSEWIKELFQFTEHFWLLWYTQFACDANLERAANMKDCAEFKYLGDQLSYSLHKCCLQLLYFSGKLACNHSDLSDLRCLSQYLYPFGWTARSSTDRIQCIFLSWTVKSLNQVFVTVIEANGITGHLGVCSLACEIQEIFKSLGITCPILVQRTGHKFIHGWIFRDRDKFFFWNRAIQKINERKTQNKRCVSFH